MAKSVPDEIADSVYVWGTPERCAARIQKMIDAGINEICLMNVGAGADPEHAASFPELASTLRTQLGLSPLRVESNA